MYQGVFHWEFDVLRGTKKGAAISARVGKFSSRDHYLVKQKSDPNSSLDFDCLARSTQLQSSCTRTHALEGMTSQIGLGPMNLQTKFSGAMSPYMKCKPLFRIPRFTDEGSGSPCVQRSANRVPTEYFVGMKRAL